MPDDKYCEVFVKDNTIYVFPNRELQPGARLVCQMVAKLDRAGSPDILGRAVLEALAAYRTDVPFPDDFQAASIAALAGTGFKNWKAFSKQAYRLGVSTDGARVTVTPTVGDGRQNFADLPDKAITRPPNPDDVGKAILEALSLCEWKSRIG